ncbi:A24 family peptidase [Saccharomonospora sp.]|uniref:prepilin peptidase n=1 Tax=Saccharomonospora sp. TaxID=33913 RepID=UPI0026210CCA|nr:A24 family peptidase [Saccharomonospora sp.]
MYEGLLLICLGAAIGWAASRSLARARRTAAVPAGWCATATGALWGVVWGLGETGALPSWWLPVPLAATAFAVPLASADLLYRRLPDVLTLPAYGLAGAAVGTAAISGPGPPLAVTALAGGGVTLAAHLLVHGIAPDSLGAGDVKLSGSLGMLAAAAGWPTLVFSLVSASLLTAGLAGAAALVGSRRWSGGVPHGPGLLAATCLGVVFPGEASVVGMGS